MPRRRVAPPRTTATRTTEGGRGRPALGFLLDQFIDVLLRESTAERRRWIAAHARAWYAQLPRHTGHLLGRQMLIEGG
jgi:hypothetical protein